MSVITIASVYTCAYEVELCECKYLCFWDVMEREGGALTPSIIAFPTTSHSAREGGGGGGWGEGEKEHNYSLVLFL